MPAPPTTLPGPLAPVAAPAVPVRRDLIFARDDSALWKFRAGSPSLERAFEHAFGEALKGARAEMGI
ncbi:hypothetical protein CDD83_1942 [Cordyceps sp. RAO-2017]|nr:hypothetical protein CDD83_1942 [Cordyceps sp. RAO-2017]